MGNPASPPRETEIERGRGSQLLGDNSLHAAMGLHSAWCTMSGSTAFCYLCVLLQTNHVPALLAGLLVLSWIHISNIWCLCGTFQRQSLENNPVPCCGSSVPVGAAESNGGCGGLGEGTLFQEMKEIELSMLTWKNWYHNCTYTWQLSVFRRLLLVSTNFWSGL